MLAVGVNVKGQVAAKTSEHFFKLSDISEAEPLPESEPVPPDSPPPQETVDQLADNMIETDQKVEQIASAAASPSQGGGAQSADEDVYVKQYEIKQVPLFDHTSIIPIYPQIALRSGIEGMVYLELFIDKYGLVRKVVILSEKPEGKGFGEAAVAAFIGKKGRPAKDEKGDDVAVRYKWPVRFSLSN
ncbi:MAG: hypothetical protein Ta2B_21740 [Termitinemataceae bacterium]|nr:MAG: hypothetical protein Ta2B_21740 [Termitinemataceae bacterium]